MNKEALQKETAAGVRIETGNIDWTSMTVLFLGVLMAILNSSTLNVAIPQLMSIFNATTAQIQWVLTGYMLVLGVVVPVTGFLGDRYGYKKTYMAALAIFIVGSALSGLAWSTSSLVMMRVIQGFGGGMIMPLTMSMIYRIVPREKIGLALGIWGMAAIAAPALGPTVGGYVVEVNWRLLFYMNLPFGLAALIMGQKHLQETEVKPHLKFDRVGITASTVGLFTLLLALSEGSDKGWQSPYIILLLGTAFISLIYFVVHELRTDQPMLDLRLFKNITFTASTLISAIMTVGMFGGVFLLPLYMQNLRHYSPLQTGEMLLWPGLVSGLFMPVSGILFDKIGPRPLIFTGVTLLGLSTYLFHDLSLTTPYGTIVAWLMLRAVGMGLATMPATTAGMNTVPVEMTGRASSLTNVFRQVSGSLGIALLTTLLQGRQNFYAYNNLTAFQENDILVLKTVGTLQAALSKTGASLQEAPSATYQYLYGIAQQDAFVRAIDDAFLVLAVVTLINLLPVLMMGGRKKEATTPTRVD